MIKIGVLGVGHLGKIHVKLLQQIPNYKLVGFFDPDEERSTQIKKTFDIQRFGEVNTLLEEVDAVDIVSPTTTHFNLAQTALLKGKHIFIEKPITHHLEEAKALVQLVQQTGLKAQVGHVERFNPAFLTAQQYDLKPLFIETHRLAQFNPRGTDVSVVLDLMIHDLDIILSIVPSKIKSVHASGVAIISKQADIANVRIAFENGCVANVTASRLSMKNMRKMRIFQREAYISVDFLNKQTELVQLNEQAPIAGAFIPLDLGDNTPSKYVSFEHPKVQAVNAIQLELELFAQSIQNNQPTAVSVEDGYRAMALAHQIEAIITANK